MKAIIMAGGKGTRLQSIAKDIPKPMFPILDKPILEYQIDSLQKSGITDITIIVGHLGDTIRDYFGDGRTRGVFIDYIVEEEPLGTAGALFFLKDKVKDDFVLIFGDLMLDVDLNRFLAFHQEREAMVSLYVHANSHPYDSDVIVIDGKSRVIKVEPKNLKRDFYYHNIVNAGLYCMSPAFLDLITMPKKIDLDKNLIAKQIDCGTVYAYRSTEYVKDVGTPDRLNAVSVDVSKGIVASRSLKNKQRAIFLDRDGTINALKGFLNNTEDFELLNGVAEAIRKINGSPYLAIVVTNQPVVARGECTFEGLEDIHKKMETDLGNQGAYIDDVFFCPHHSHKGYDGEILELKFDCKCRKPKIGMLMQAAEKYNIDLSQCWFVGDTTIDIQTGKNAEMKTILLKTGESGQDGKYNVLPTHVADTLLDAINYILN